MRMPPLLLETKPNSYIWKVAEDYTVTVRQNTYTVPKGFETDLASVPRLFQNMFPSDGKYKEQAVLHDYLLTSNTMSRRMADKIFYYAMIDNGIKPLTAYVLYQAVRLYSRSKRLDIF